MTAILRYFIFILALGWSESADAVAERSRYRTEYACEGNTLHLDCEPGYVIHLIRANYGRFSITVCNNHGQTDWSVNCMSPRSLRVLHSRCSNRPRCSILANSTIFGDPCEGTFKYLVAHYQCLPAALTIKRPSLPTSSPTPVADNNGLFSSLTTLASSSTASPSSDDIASNSSVIFEGVLQHGDDFHGINGSSSDDTSGFPRPAAEEGHAVLSETPSSSTSMSSSTSEPTSTTPYSHFEPTQPQQRQPSATNSRQINADSGVVHVDHSDGYDTMVDVDLTTSDTACPPRVARGLLWNWTAAGYIREQGCPGGASGLAAWRCDGPQWMSEYPDLSQCRSLWLNSLRNRLKAQESAMTVASELLKVTASKPLFGGDIWLSAEIIAGLARTIRDASDPSRAREVMSAVVRSGSHLLGRGQAASWTDLPIEQRGPAATQLLISFEDSAFAMAQITPIDEAEVFAEENLLAVVQVVDARKNEPVHFPTDRERSLWGRGADEVSIELHPEDVVKNSHRGRTQIAFFSYENLQDILGEIATAGVFTPLNDARNDGDDHVVAGMAGPASSLSTSFVNSRVVSACLGSGRHVQLSHPAVLTFQHRLVRNVTTNPRCVFWDYTTSSWSSAGCRVRDSNSTHTSCECDHLTNFALLMDLDPTSSSTPIDSDRHTESHASTLRVVSYVGCAVAIVCLLVAFVAVFHYSSSISSSSSSTSAGSNKSGSVVVAVDDRACVHKHLCLTLLISELTYAAGLYQTGNAVFCGFVAGLLQYIFMAAFGWMLVEAFHLYRSSVAAFEPESSKMRWYYVVAYGLPAVVVVTSAIVDPYSYGTRDHCWLNSENYFVLSFIAPVVASLLVTLVFLALSFVSVCRHRSGSVTTKEENRLSKLTSWLRGSSTLVCLMAVTWSLGLVLRVHREYGSSFAVALAFCVFNMLQGAFMLFFSCCQNEKVWNYYRGGSERTCLSRLLAVGSDKKAGFYVSPENCGGQNSTHSTNASIITTPGANQDERSIDVNTMPLSAHGYLMEQCQQQQLEHHNCAGSFNPYSGANGTCARHADLWNAAQTMLHHHHSMGPGTARRLATGPRSLQHHHHIHQQQQQGLMPIVHGRSVSSPGSNMLRNGQVVHPGAMTMRQPHQHQQLCAAGAACRTLHTSYNQHTYSEIDPVYSEIENSRGFIREERPSTMTTSASNEYLVDNAGRLCPLSHIPICPAAMDHCYYPSAAATAGRHLVPAHHAHGPGYCSCSEGKPLMNSMDGSGNNNNQLYESQYMGTIGDQSSTSSSSSPPSMSTLTTAASHFTHHQLRQQQAPFHHHIVHQPQQQTDDFKSTMA